MAQIRHKSLPRYTRLTTPNQCKMLNKLPHVGASDGTRTHGIQDHNLALCQLSYARHRSVWWPATRPAPRPRFRPRTYPKRIPTGGGDASTPSAPRRQRGCVPRAMAQAMPKNLASNPPHRPTARRIGGAHTARHTTRLAALPSGTTRANFSCCHMHAVPAALRKEDARHHPGVRST
jgi:hypothetical protein